MPGPVVVAWIEHDIHPQKVESYLAATLENAAQTALEPGNLRFDVLSDPEDPNRFILYEVYVDKAAQQAHLASDHFQAWKAAVRGAIAKGKIRKLDSLHTKRRG